MAPRATCTYAMRPAPSSWRAWAAPGGHRGCAPAGGRARGAAGPAGRGKTAWGTSPPIVHWCGRAGGVAAARSFLLLAPWRLACLRVARGLGVHIGHLEPLRLVE